MDLWTDCQFQDTVASLVERKQDKKYEYEES